MISDAYTRDYDEQKKLQTFLRLQSTVLSLMAKKGYQVLSITETCVTIGEHNRVAKEFSTLKEAKEWLEGKTLFKLG